MPNTLNTEKNTHLQILTSDLNASVKSQSKNKFKNKVSPAALFNSNDNNSNISERNIKKYFSLKEITNFFYNILKTFVYTVVHIFKDILNKIYSCFVNIIAKALFLDGNKKNTVSIAENKYQDSTVATVIEHKKTEEIIGNKDKTTSNTPCNNTNKENKLTASSNEYITENNEPKANATIEPPINNNIQQTPKNIASLDETTNNTQNNSTNEENNFLNSCVTPNQGNNLQDLDVAIVPKDTYQVANQQKQSDLHSNNTFSRIFKTTYSTITKTLNKPFDTFFIHSATNCYNTHNFLQMLSYSATDFNRLFIESATNYLASNSNTTLKPFNIITFIKEKIFFVDKVINPQKASHKKNIKKLSQMINTALEQYIENCIKNIANETKTFTSSNIIDCISSQLITIIQGAPPSEERANREFLIDVDRDMGSIAFFLNGTLFWNSSNEEFTQLQQKLITCNKNIVSIKNHTEGHDDALAEIETIKTKLIQNQRSIIQNFLMNETGVLPFGAVNTILLEHTQSGTGLPSELAFNYIGKKLNDLSNNDSDIQIASINKNRVMKKEFFYSEKNKNILKIKSYLSGTVTVLIKDKHIDNIFKYQAITETEYDLKNSNNNRVITGKIKLYS